MKKRSFIKYATFAVLLAVLCTAVFCAPATSVALAESTLPETYLSQWYDAEEFLNYEASLQSVNEMLAQKSAAELQAFKDDPIVIAVIDTGVYYEHEVFKDVLYHNVAELNGVADVDDDNNDYIDDVNGWDFVSNDNKPLDECTKYKLDSHGTHVAGIIAAEIIKYGLTDYIKIMPIRAGDSDGGFNNISANVNSVNYAADNGADVINMSFRCYQSAGSLTNWGKGSDFDDAVQDAASRGVILVAAAGNDNTESDSLSNTSSPAALDNVIGVMAYNKEGARWITDSEHASNYGEAYDVFAPGVGILSAVRGNYVRYTGDGYTLNDGYKYALKTGTSMATPIVSFMAAVMMIKYDRNADYANYTFASCATNLLDNEYKMVSLTDYLAYKPISEFTMEAASGDTEQFALMTSEITFSASLKLYGDDDFAPVGNEAYNDVLWYVYPCDKDGDTSGKTPLINGAEGKDFKYTPTEPGYYKVFAKIKRTLNLESESVIVKVAYATRDEVELTVTGGDEKVVRAGGSYTYRVDNLKYLNPDENGVIWTIYKDGALFAKTNAAELNFKPIEKGEYKIVCQLASTSETVGEYTVSVKMSEEAVKEVSGGVTTGVILAAVFGLLLAVVVKKVLEKR